MRRIAIEDHVDHVRVREIAATMGVRSDSCVMSGDWDLVRFEHLVHEVGHALSLRIPLFDPLVRLEGRIETARKRLRDRRKGADYRNEALVLAAERRLFCDLLCDRSPWEQTLFEIADDQDCVAQFHAACRGLQHYSLAIKITRCLNDLRVFRPAMVNRLQCLLPTVKVPAESVPGTREPNPFL